VDLLDGFDEWLLNHRKSENTRKTYIRSLTQFCEWLDEHKSDLFCITKKDIQAYMDFLELQQRSGATIEKVFAAIRIFAHFQQKEDIVENIKRKENIRDRSISPEFLSEEDQRYLLSSVERDGNFRNIAIIYILLYTGIRVSELCALNRFDIEINDQIGKLTIRSDGEIERIIPLSRDVRIYLKRYLESKNSKEQALFVSNLNKRMTTRAVQYILQKYNVHPHKLRHTFCRKLIEEGVGITTVAKLAGHSDINVTKRYSKRLTNTHMENAIQKAFA